MLHDVPGLPDQHHGHCNYADLHSTLCAVFQALQVMQSEAWPSGMLSLSERLRTQVQVELGVRVVDKPKGEQGQ